MTLSQKLYLFCAGILFIPFLFGLLTGNISISISHAIFISVFLVFAKLDEIIEKLRRK